MPNKCKLSGPEYQNEDYWIHWEKFVVRGGSLASSSASIRVEQVSLASGSVALKPGTSVLPPGAHYLLKDLSFQAFRGDRLVLVGPSGSGKTSLLRLLNRLSEPTQGTIYLDDRDIRQIPINQLRREVVLVLQESRLLGMAVQQALVYPLQLRNLPSTTIQQRLGEWLERLHIPSDWLDRTEVQLSIGQRQLVSIARALMIQPQVLLLDEPTSALDAGRSAHLLTVLAELVQSQQMTLIMANHQLDQAQQFSTRTLYLERGRLLYDLEAAATDWEMLQESLVQAETRAAAEWE